MDSLDFSVARWLITDDLASVKNTLDSRTKLVFDHKERPLILFSNQITLDYYMQKHPDIKVVEALEINKKL